MTLDPNHSHDRDLTQAVSVRWWGLSSNLDINWRYPSQGGPDAHPVGTPLLRVTGTLSKGEARRLWAFLDEILGDGP